MKFVKYFFILVFCCIFLGTASIYGMYKYVEGELPDVATMKDIRLQIPMQVYSADNELIAQYGEKRRIPLPLAEIPPLMVKAFIATEDSRFYDHHGIDPIGIFRAVSVMASSGHASQGASTITQQLARNFYLSPEKTLMRKAKEAFLAIRIEQLFSKDEIMELYLNKIYLGNRAYGVGAAAYVYFGKTVNELTLSEMAMIAGLPKAPSTFNPLYSYDRAVNRRNVVLSRMLEEKYITKDQYEQARNEKIVASYHAPKIDFSAPYLAEMARQTLYDKYGEDAYTDGYKVYTTVIRKDQEAATDAVRNNLIDYDTRHGYRGPAEMLWKPSETAWASEKIIEKLKKSPVYGPLMPAVVLSATGSEANVMLADGSKIDITMTGVRWARKFISDTQQGASPRAVNAVVQAGEQIWVRKVKDNWWLGQVPDVNAAFVALNPNDGAIIALVGGFDFNMSEFNRVTQSLRQVGSNIKPFLYTAAMDKGLTLSSLLNDVPISRWDAGAGSDWRPKNSPPRYDGPIRLRQGLGQSKNVVMVRAMRAMGVDYAADYLMRFGFPRENINRTEALALGAPSFTPMQMVRGYAVMVNGGYLVDPYYILKIENHNDEVIFEANPKLACPDCTNIPVVYGDTERTIEMKGIDDESTEEVTQSGHSVMNQEPTMEVATSGDENVSSEPQYAPHVIGTPLAFLIRDAMMTNIYGEPGWSGTGWRAARDLGGRRDIGGKTGTTNSSKDAWFSGYGPDVVASAWIGFDDNKRTLGRGEAGAKSAQPMWDDFMKSILAGVPVKTMKPPKGVISVSIDSRTGKLGSSRREYFIEGTEPKEYSVQEVGTTISTEGGSSQELF
ncbi:peptidoglycan glycosyltransferase/peptidoglycan DD-transpeptidase MrcA [Providencia sp.]|uniref:peptidoglycan glycosyltransferase/peptidoglycan DD-transpeptidase MrcA n=1 Tax=Providencia sp. TaxID=589 RepID=UPI0033417D48